MNLNSIILITGGTGSWGQELVHKLLLEHNPKEIRIYSRGEHKQVEMKRRFKDSRIKYFVGDVRDKNRLSIVSKGVELIFHLAALKHVPVCEENPWEAVQTNIIGTQNIIEVAIENGVKKVIDVSTDKAVDPLNLYGVSKACGEKLIIAANINNTNTKFVCVRGGNVIGTNGSVVPLFKEQILKANEITITNKDMTRFFMRLEEAIDLVLKATIDSQGGEIYVMKMPAIRIPDLAQVMIEELGAENTKISEIGIRPGEKLYEVLVSKYEVSRTFDLDRYFVILPQINIDNSYNKYTKSSLLEEYNSENTQILSKKEIAELLNKDGWLDTSAKQEALLYLETLSKNDLTNFFTSEGWGKK